MASHNAKHGMGTGGRHGPALRQLSIGPGRPRAVPDEGIVVMIQKADQTLAVFLLDSGDAARRLLSNVERIDQGDKNVKIVDAAIADHNKRGRFPGNRAVRLRPVGRNFECAGPNPFDRSLYFHLSACRG